jgi:hypothetical protein
MRNYPWQEWTDNQDRVYLVSLFCEGGVASGNSYNRMSAPTALRPEHLPDVEVLAVGEGGEEGCTVPCIPAL